MNQKPHSPEFKEQALRKLRERGSRTQQSVADELNICLSTLKGWLQGSKKLAGGLPHGANPLPADIPAVAWGASERLQALNESHALSGEALHAWCREKGLFVHQLQAWREAFLLGSEPTTRDSRSAVRELQSKNDLLERQLRRKDKALAEAAALGAAKKVPGAVGGRGLMTTAEQRQTLLPLIEQAIHNGARLRHACAQIGLSCRTVQRWSQSCALAGDRRVGSLRAKAAPPNQLSLAERDAVMQVLNSHEFKDLAPSQIVPRLADAGQYVASESTMYRLLHASAQMGHRRLERVPRKVSKPRALVATQPNQVYCWDITYLPAPVRGMHFYLYLFVDIFSRKIVGWQVFDRESAELAAGLLHDVCARLGIAQGQLTVHSDNGSPMKGETMLATMQRLGIAASRSRPSVSNDNPYSESLFRTLKYRPARPLAPFKDILHARRWVGELVHWYNLEHRHSAIRFVTPHQRHAGLDKSMLESREVVYAAARQANPNRWSGSTRNWNPINEVHLNPTTAPSKKSKTTHKAV